MICVSGYLTSYSRIVLNFFGHADYVMLSLDPEGLLLAVLIKCVGFIYFFDRCFWPCDDMIFHELLFFMLPRLWGRDCLLECCISCWINCWLGWIIFWQGANGWSVPGYASQLSVVPP